MQNRRGPPSHPSLPPNPLLYNNPGHVGQQSQGIAQNQPANLGALAAHALTSSLTNTYSPNPYSYTNANYHAYFAQNQHPSYTAQGYTLSTTYVRQPFDTQSQEQPIPRFQTQHGQGSSNNRPPQNFTRSLDENSFAAPGDAKCTHAGCSFTGSKKTVEIHRMDRHLIFPPGWKKRTSDWDADPSLKGKPIPIPGTGVTLNTPEAIDAWIAERKKRWPTNGRVEDKKRKVQEALNRGEIDPSELTAKGHKRKRVEGDQPESEERGRRRGRGRGRGRGRERGVWKGGTTDSGWRGRGGAAAPGRPLAPRANAGDNAASSSSSDEDLSDSGSDMDPIKDAVSSKAPNPESDPRILEDVTDESHRIVPIDDPHDDEHVASSRDPFSQKGRAPRRQQLVQPKTPLPNPFASRPSLLRSLLLPEIRHTVSNLSQAIHFLVENDFLEGVELKPGESDSQLIKVLDSTSIGRSEAPSENLIQE